MSSHSSRSPPRPDRSGGGLDNFRVLEQCRPDPTDTPPLPQSSRTFRVTAFVFHMGMSMLESRRGHAALINLISESWRASDRRAKKTFIPKQNLQAESEETRRFVDRFLTKCRADPPNIIVSDRITGEGLAQRANWPEVLGSTVRDYNAKWAAVFRLNKTVIDSAVAAAESRDIETLQRVLFLMSISVAHELVHMLMGFMFGDPDRLTPPVINHPPGTPRGVAAGESGRFWEFKFFGCITEAYYNSKDPRGRLQSGTFFGTVGGGRGFPMQLETIQGYLRLDFTNRLFEPSMTTVRIPNKTIAMQDTRQPSKSPDFGGDLTPYFEMINSLPTERVSRDVLAQIMGMATQPQFIRSVPVRGP